MSLRNLISTFAKPRSSITSISVVNRIANWHRPRQTVIMISKWFHKKDNKILVIWERMRFGGNASMNLRHKILGFVLKHRTRQLYATFSVQKPGRQCQSIFWIECDALIFGFVPNVAHEQRISSTGGQSRRMGRDVNVSSRLPIEPHAWNID